MPGPRCPPIMKSLHTIARELADALDGAEFPDPKDFAKAQQALNVFDQHDAKTKALLALAELVDEAQANQQTLHPNRRGAKFAAIAESARLVKEAIRK